MRGSRETGIINTLCIALVLMAGVFRIIAKKIQPFSYNIVIFALFTVAVMLWIFQLKKRLVQSDVRKNLIAAAILIIFWMALRTLKYEFTISGHFTARYAWYMYYIPMMFIPLLIFLSVIAVGRPYNKPADRKWRLLFIPTAVIVLGILTNDLHQMAFRFKDGLALWDENNIVRGIAYYAAIVWMVLILIATLAVVFIRCAVPERRKMIWLPMLPLLIGLVYLLCDLYDRNNLLIIMFCMPEIGCVIYAAFVECLICVHLFPTNDNYGAFWNASSIGAGIMDTYGNILYKSEKSLDVTPQQVRQAENRAVILSNGEVSLRSHAVHGGYGYWIRDISEINRLNGELEDLGNVTAEENAMLKAENKMKSERIRIEEQNKLYDDMARGVKAQIDILSGLLDNPPEDEAAFERTMKYACIINAYVKRHSNLILLCHQSDTIQSEELRHAVNESLEYVQLYGIKTRCTFNGKGAVPKRAALLAHEFFENVLETSIPGTDAILVYLNAADNKFTMLVQAHAPARFIDGNCMSEEIAALGGTLETETEEDTEYVTLTLPSGGEKS